MGALSVWLAPTFDLHSDHAKYLKELQIRGVEAFSCKDVAKNIQGVKKLLPNKKYRIGEFTIIPFNVDHNVECYGYLVEHEEMGKLVWITDAANAPYKFKDVNHILIETNHDEDFMIDNLCDNKFSSSAHFNHLSLDKAVDFVRANSTANLQNVIALHLSSTNIDAKLVKDRFLEELGLRVYIAKQGLEVELTKEEF